MAESGLNFGLVEFVLRQEYLVLSMLAAPSAVMEGRFLPPGSIGRTVDQALGVGLQFWIFLNPFPILDL